MDFLQNITPLQLWIIGLSALGILIIATIYAAKGIMRSNKREMQDLTIKERRYGANYPEGAPGRPGTMPRPQPKPRPKVRRESSTFAFEDELEDAELNLLPDDSDSGGSDD